MEADERSPAPIPSSGHETLVRPVCVTTAAGDAWLDEALANTFPASDPIPVHPGSD